MRRWMLPLAALLVLIPILAGAQGPGLFLRPDCTVITSSATGRTWCFDATTSILKVWNGTAFVPAAAVPAYTLAGLPAAGTAGRLARVTDDVGGMWMDGGSQWRPLGPFVDVTQPPFNAKGDGTTDDTAAIQAALNSGARIVLLPAATYSVTGNPALTIPANVTVLGVGWTASILKHVGTTAARVLHTNGNSDITFRDFQIDGNDAAVGKQGVAILNGSNRVTVEHVKTVKCGQYGILVGDTGSAGGGGGHIIRNNHVDMTGVVDANGPIGIEVFPRGGAGYLADPGALVEGNIVIGGTAINGIKLNAQRGGRVVNNYVSGVTSATAAGGIGVVSSEHTLVAQNVVSGSRLGIVFSGQAGADNALRNTNISIIGNIVRAYTDTGLFASDGFDGLLIQGNVLDRDGAAGAMGIDLQPAVSGAEFTRLVIAQNLFYERGIILRAQGALGAPRAVIVENVLHNVVGVPISINTSPSSKIANNVITDGNTGNTANLAGIFIGTSSASQITGNYVENIAGGLGFLKYGISNSASNDLVLRDNQFIGMNTGNIIESGTITTGVPRGQEVRVANATVTLTADTAETTLKSSVIDAGALTRFGGVRITVAGTVSGTANTKTIRLKLVNTVATITFAAGATGDWMIDAVMMMADSLSAQRWVIRAYEGTALEAGFPDYVTSAITMTTARTLSVTGQLANGADTITAEMWTVEILN